MINFGAIGKTVGTGLGNLASGVANKKILEEKENALKGNKAYFNTEIENMANEYDSEMQPWTESGVNALSNYENMDTQVANYGNNGQGFEMTDFEASPSYDWRMSQGIDTLDAGAASDGSLFSGGQNKDLMEFGQNLASDEYENEYNRQLAEYQDTRDYNTSLDSANVSNLANQYDTLMNQGYNATKLNANTQLGLNENQVQGNLDINSQFGDIIGAKKANKWNIMGDQANIAGQGADDYFSFGG